MPYCDIMQGIPGSGKSTKAESLLTHTCSADAYFVGGDGTYTFNPAHLGKAHTQCMREFLSLVHRGLHVCVDNTNTTLEEMVPYVRVAQAMGYMVRVHTHVCPPDIAADRNTHGVPLSVCVRMSRRLTMPPAMWDVEHSVVHTG